MILEVLFTPADFEFLAKRDLGRVTCVVFDVLRATSTMLTALANGAKQIIPVSDIAEALALHQARPEVLLAGERRGRRIPPSLTGGVRFDLGNSPREFRAQKVRGKTIVMTTTNGTRALRVCARAQTTLIAAFLNLRAVADWLRARQPGHLVLVCAGTQEEMAYEDVLAAGALVELLGGLYPDQADSAQVARWIYRSAPRDLMKVMPQARNARRLLSLKPLADDVAFCLQRNTLSLVAGLDQDGAVKLFNEGSAAGRRPRAGAGR